MRNASRLRVPFATGTGAFATAMVRAFCDAKRCFSHGFGRVVVAVLLMFLLQFFCNGWRKGAAAAAGAASTR
jgi:hypothetical protein